MTAAVKRPRRKLVAIVAAAVLVVGGGVAAAVGVAQYNADTTRLCDVALVSGTDARTAQQASLAAADTALEAVESIELPDGGMSTLYADLPAVDAAAATGTAPAVEARPSGAERIAAATEAEAVLADVEVADECSDRDQATAVTEAIDEAVAALSDDFAAFQVDEAARLAAEKKAAEEAAAAEAARIAAEQAAAEEAARQAEQDSYDDGGYDNGGGGGNNGGGGGGQIIPPNGGGGCPPGTTFQGEACS